MEPENERADCFGRKQHMEPENDGFQVRNLLFQKPYFSGSTLNFRGVKENFPLEPRKNPDRILFMSHPGCLMQGSLFNCSWNNPRITGQRPLFSLLKWRLRLFTRFIALTVEVFLVNKKNSSLKKGWIYRTPPKRHPKSRWLEAFMKSLARDPWRLKIVSKVVTDGASILGGELKGLFTTIWLFSFKALLGGSFSNPHLWAIKFKVRPFGRETTPLKGLTITMIINHLQVLGWSSKYPRFSKPLGGSKLSLNVKFRGFGFHEYQQYCDVQQALSKWVVVTPIWYPKQPFFNGCHSLMIPNPYIKTGCFAKHP